ncbi:MAG: CpsB/CapC family capsule biosynthesis tyrosine phosphatase [Pseudomonadota bacterium]
MIDLHCHILPGVDDGATAMTESLRMAVCAYQDGIRCVVATPHNGSGKYPTRAEVMEKTVETVNAALAVKGIGLTVLPGMEARVTPDLLDRLLQKEVSTINGGQYLLIELPAPQVPAGFEILLQQLVAHGFRPILAHPEKNFFIQEHVQYLYKLLLSFSPGDLLVQITADSLMDEAGRPAAKSAAIMLEHNLAHILATDAHSSQIRPPILSPAVSRTARVVGPDRARRMVLEIPLAVVEGRDASPYIEAPSNPRRWWRIL